MCAYIKNLNYVLLLKQLKARFCCKSYLEGDYIFWSNYFLTEGSLIAISKMVKNSSVALLVPEILQFQNLIFGPKYLANHMQEFGPAHLRSSTFSALSNGASHFLDLTHGFPGNRGFVKAVLFRKFDSPHFQEHIFKVDYHLKCSQGICLPPHWVWLG